MEILVLHLGDAGRVVYLTKARPLKIPDSKFTILITLSISRHYGELSEVEVSAGHGNRISSIHKQTFQHGIEAEDMGLTSLQGFTEKGSRGRQNTTNSSKHDNERATQA